MDWIFCLEFLGLLLWKKAQKKELPNSATRFGLYQSRLTHHNILFLLCQEKKFEKKFENDLTSFQIFLKGCDHSQILNGAKPFSLKFSPYKPRKASFRLYVNRNKDWDR
jgi:hypothetical protein